MLPNQFIDDFRKLKDQRPDHEVVVRLVAANGSSWTRIVTNIVIGPQGVELVCEPV